MKHITYIGNHLHSATSLPTGVGFLGKALEEEGFRVTTASAKKNKFLRLLDMLLVVFRNAKTTDFVLIDTYSTTNFWFSYAVARLCQKLKLKYIPILHGGNLPQRLKRSPKACRVVFGRAHLNVVPSLYLMEEFQKAGFLNLKYIPNSIDLKDYPFVERKIYEPKLLWVRAFANIYNPLLAIKVFEMIREKYPRAELCMVGPKKDGSWEECRQYSLKQQLPIRFTGRLEKKEWIQLSTNFDIFINSTNVDNTPLSLIEAMALGLPVVSTNVGGIPFLIDEQKTGVLVAPNDPEAMVLAIEALLENPIKTSELVFEARKKVDNFDWKLVRSEWLEILKARRINE